MSEKITIYAGGQCAFSVDGRHEDSTWPGPPNAPASTYHVCDHCRSVFVANDYRTKDRAPEDEITAPDLPVPDGSIVTVEGMAVVQQALRDELREAEESEAKLIGALKIANDLTTELMARAEKAETDASAAEAALAAVENIKVVKELRAAEAEALRAELLVEDASLWLRHIPDAVAVELTQRCGALLTTPPASDRLAMHHSVGESGEG